MALYTRQELQRLKAQFPKVMSDVAVKGIDSVLLDEFSKELTKDSFHIFLSHCYLDKDEILLLKLDFERMGYQVYVDWMVDHNLNRTNVTKDTAEKLRSRLNQSKSLFFATSRNSIDSRWMPWELGYFDGNKGRAAILPILTGGQLSDKYIGQEYLGLYNYITKGMTRAGLDKLWVHESEDKYVLFDSWLEGEEPFKRDQKEG